MTRQSGSFSLQILEDLQQELPGASCGGDLQLFPAGMDVMHIRADGNAIQPRQLVAENTALQAGMDGYHLRLFAEHIPEDPDHGIP